MFWYDDGKRYLPGEREPKLSVEIPLPSTDYEVTETPTQVGREGVSRRMLANNRTIRLEIGATPVFIERSDRVATRKKTASKGGLRTTFLLRKKEGFSLDRAAVILTDAAVRRRFQLFRLIV